MNRGRSREVIFPDDDAYAAFLNTLSEAVARFRIEVHAYCLMPNHYHLLLRTPHANLSRSMRQIDGLYTQRHNQLAGRDGSLFRGRYKAIVVDADAYLLNVSRYIHRNPIEANPPLVEALPEWPWSSYPAFIGRAKAPDWLTTATTYALFGAGRRPKRYRDFVEAGVDEVTAQFYEGQRRTPVFGDHAFRKRAMAKARSTEEVPIYQRRPLYDPDTLIQAVAAAYGVSPETLTSRGNKPPTLSDARARAMWLCREDAGLTLAAIGQRFGALHYASVNTAIRRLNATTTGDELPNWRGRIVEQLPPTS